MAEIALGNTSVGSSVVVAHVATGVIIAMGSGIATISVAPMFADQDVGGVAILAAVFSGIGYGGKWIADQWSKRKQAKTEEEQRDYARRQTEKSSEIQHLESLVTRYQTEVTQLHAENRELNRRLSREERRGTKAEAWIRAQQMILKTQKIDFVPYDLSDDDDDDSDDHVVRLHGPDTNSSPAGGI